MGYNIAWQLLHILPDTRFKQILSYSTVKKQQSWMSKIFRQNKFKQYFSIAFTTCLHLNLNVDL